MTVWRFGPWTPQLKSAAFRVSQTYCWPQSSTCLAQTPHHSRTPRLQRRPLKAAPSSSKHFLPKPSWGRLEAKYLDWMGGRGHPSEGYFTQAMGSEAACCAGMLGPTVLENHRILFSQLNDASCTLCGGSTPTMCSELSRWPLSSPFTLLLTWRTYQVEWFSLCIGRHGSDSSSTNTKKEVWHAQSLMPRRIQGWTLILAFKGTFQFCLGNLGFLVNNKKARVSVSLSTAFIQFPKSW